MKLSTYQPIIITKNNNTQHLKNEIELCSFSITSFFFSFQYGNYVSLIDNIYHVNEEVYDELSTKISLISITHGITHGIMLGYAFE